MGNLALGVYKYVILEAPIFKVYIENTNTGKTHRGMCAPGDVVEHAGFIAAMGDGGWAHGSAVSDSLGIDGDDDHDIEHLTRYFGRRPERMEDADAV